MGGPGSGRPPSEETIVARQTQNFAPVVPNDFVLPNYSGIKDEAIKGSSSTYPVITRNALSGGVAILSGGLIYEDPNMPLYIDVANNRVGINSINPDSLLQINGSGGGAQSYIHLRDISDTTDLILGYDGNNFKIHSETTAGVIYFNFSNNTGNIAIGHSTPRFKLHISGAAEMSGAFFHNTTAPTLSLAYSSGACFVSGGALWYLGATGTTTQIAPA